MLDLRNIFEINWMAKTKKFKLQNCKKQKAELTTQMLLPKRNNPLLSSSPKRLNMNRFCKIYQFRRNLEKVEDNQAKNLQLITKNSKAN